MLKLTIKTPFVCNSYAGPISKPSFLLHQDYLSIHKDNGLSDSLPFIDLLIHFQVSFRAREQEIAEGCLKNKNSFETPMDRRPQQPLLGCHRALKREREKRRGLG